MAEDLVANLKADGYTVPLYHKNPSLPPLSSASSQQPPSKQIQFVPITAIIPAHPIFHLPGLPSPNINSGGPFHEPLCRELKAETVTSPVLIGIINYIHKEELVDLRTMMTVILMEEAPDIVLLKGLPRTGWVIPMTPTSLMEAMTEDINQEGVNHLMTLTVQMTQTILMAIIDPRSPPRAVE
ncbi:hypothetical protein BDN71DRAFT_1432609 [Pleurotus eryngii]|uniref:Uncharacterized protein n=1 Tax=Pleurotus eryngii TaxID=5323 RepID=A0A9P6DF52_PLEER|nr:hypothetical protein BDN71DRAFT_1432609 [Pleurotus eryngii]